VVRWCAKRLSSILQHDSDPPMLEIRPEVDEYSLGEF
jgi:hypothetical protein